jgi:microcystin-dependent protein
MGTTTKLGLPYPEGDEPDDVPLDVKELAERLDAIAGAASGLATLDAAGKVPAAQAPSSVPTGALFAWPAAAAPTGYRLCDGSPVSRSTYSDLFAVIGTTYGAGDGSTTFNLPNLKGRVPAGLDAAQTEFNTLGKIGGEKTHVLTAAEMPVHNHSWSGNVSGSGQANNNVLYDTGGSSGVTPQAGSRSLQWGQVGVSWSGSVSGSVGNAGSGGAHNVLQPYVTLNYIIKT